MFNVLQETVKHSSRLQASKCWSRVGGGYKWRNSGEWCVSCGSTLDNGIVRHRHPAHNNTVGYSNKLEYGIKNNCYSLPPNFTRTVKLQYIITFMGQNKSRFKQNYDKLIFEWYFLNLVNVPLNLV